MNKKSKEEKQVSTVESVSHDSVVGPRYYHFIPLKPYLDKVRKQQQDYYKAAELVSMISENRDGFAMSANEFCKLCGAGTPQQIKAAIETGADVNARHEDSWTDLWGFRNLLSRTPLICAARNNGNSEVITLLLTAGAEIDARGDNGMTALMHSVDNKNNPEVIAALIEAGANLDVRGIGGYTALMYAIAYNGNPEVIFALLKGGADVNIRSNYNSTAFPRKLGQTALIMAVRYSGDLSLIKALLERGADVSVRDKQGRTALMCAAKNRSLEVINTLIDSGADVNARDNNAQSVLMFASKHNTSEVVSAMLNAGADVDAQAQNGMTAIDHAKKNPKLQGTDILDRLRETSKSLSVEEMQAVTIGSAPFV